MFDPETPASSFLFRFPRAASAVERPILYGCFFARQEQVIQGVIQATRAMGNGAWKLGDFSGNVEYLNQWLPAYEETVECVKRSATPTERGMSIPIIFR